MTEIEKRLEETIKKLEGFEKEKYKVEARRDQLLEQLAAQGISSVEEGRKKQKENDALRQQLEAEALGLLDKFEEDYREFL